MTVIVLLVIKSTLVLGAGLLVSHLLRRRAAALRHAVLVTTVLGAAALPLVGTVAPAWSPLPVVDTRVGEEPLAGAATNAVSTATSVATARAAPAPGSAVAPSTVVLGLWALAAACALVVLVRDLWRVRRLNLDSTTLRDRRWLRLLDETRAALGVSPRVALRRGADDAPVVTWGVRRPHILVPATATAWPEAQVRQVLLHELGHVARHDWAWHLVLAATGAVYCWHPLMRMAIRGARREAERACDDVVLRAGTAASAYASTLLDVARTRRALPAAAALAMAAPSSLEGRITAMLDPGMDHSPLPRTARGFVAATVLVFTVAIAGLGARQQADGTISGTVLPAGGTPLPGVTVTFTGPKTVSAVTDAQGAFTATLPGGTYRAEIRKPGFKRMSARVDVAPGEAITRDFALALGAVSESINVSAAAAPPAAPTERDFRRPPPPQADPFGGSIEPPKKLKDVKPVYPEALKDAGVGGKVLLTARIGVDGFVTDVQVVSSPHDGLTAAAVEAVEQWKFAPTQLQGRAVPTEMNVTIEFTAS